MKRIFIYITLGMTIVSMLLAGNLPVKAQEKQIFFETMKSGDILGEMMDDETLFRLLDRGNLSPESSQLGSCKADQKQELMDYLESKSGKMGIPDGLKVAFGRANADGRCKVYALDSPVPEYSPGITDIKSVSLNQDPGTGYFNILLSFNKKGSKSWAEMTRSNLGRDIAIMLDGEVLSAPRVMQEIKAGKCLINGSLSKNQAEEIQRSLGH